MATKAREKAILAGSRDPELAANPQSHYINAAEILFCLKDYRIILTTNLLLKTDCLQSYAISDAVGCADPAQDIIRTKSCVKNGTKHPIFDSIIRQYIDIREARFLPGSISDAYAGNWISFITISRFVGY